MYVVMHDIICSEAWCVWYYITLLSVGRGNVVVMHGVICSEACSRRHPPAPLTTLLLSGHRSLVGSSFIPGVLADAAFLVFLDLAEYNCFPMMISEKRQSLFDEEG